MNIPVEKWLISKGAFILLEMREMNGKLQGRIDGRGWFAPQWMDIPDDAAAFLYSTPARPSWSELEAHAEQRAENEYSHSEEAHT